MKHLKRLLSMTIIAFGLGFWQAASAQDDVAFTQGELDQMLAPIALYPDTVLSHVLIAATYPLEIVEAARWSRTYPDLRGEEAVAQVEHRDWDASVKALVAFPELLQRMDRDLSWTRDLGDAFLAQEGDVVDTVQYLRNQAYDEGNLVTDEHVRVVRETQYIYIEPVQPRTVYVPYYDPRVVYGSWRWAAYPPVYWPRPVGFSLGINFYWGSGFVISPSFYFSAFHWPYRQVVVVNHHHHHGGYFQRPHRAFHAPPRHAQGHGPSRWRHDRHHRRGVNYRHAVEPARFATASGAKVKSGRVDRTPAMPVQRKTDARRFASRLGESKAHGPTQRSRTEPSRQVRTPGERASAAKARELDQRAQPARRFGDSTGPKSKSDRRLAEAGDRRSVIRPGSSQSRTDARQRKPSVASRSPERSVTPMPRSSSRTVKPQPQRSVKSVQRSSRTVQAPPTRASRPVQGSSRPVQAPTQRSYKSVQRSAPPPTTRAPSRPAAARPSRNAGSAGKSSARQSGRPSGPRR